MLMVTGKHLALFQAHSKAVLLAELMGLQCHEGRVLAQACLVIGTCQSQWQLRQAAI